MTETQVPYDDLLRFVQRLADNRKNGELFEGELVSFDGQTAVEAYETVIGEARELLGMPDFETAQYDFLISNDGIVSIDTGWKRDTEATMVRLMCAGITLAEAEIATWTDAQIQSADLWAIAVHFNASDNDDIQVPAKPDFLSKRERSEISCS